MCCDDPRITFLCLSLIGNPFAPTSEGVFLDLKIIYVDINAIYVNIYPIYVNINAIYVNIYSIYVNINNFTLLPISYDSFLYKKVLSC